jgi:hypothetical protein
LRRRRRGCYHDDVERAASPRPARPLPWLALGLVAALWSADAAAETVAFLPASGSADVDSRGRLDVQLRKAMAKAWPDLTVQPAKETGSAMSTLIDLNGEICENEDIPCLSKLGILADVNTLVVVEASGKKSLAIDITLIDVEAGTVKRQVEGDVVLGDAGSAEALVRNVFGAAEVPRIIETTPTTPTTSTTPTPELPRGEGPIDETKLTDLQFAGASVAAVGGGVGVLGLLGALGCEAVFWTGTGSKDVRKDIVAPLGSVLWIGTIVGAVAAGAGGALYLAGSPDEDKRVE